MRSSHRLSFAEAQLPTLKRRSARPAPVLFSSCPLCGAVPSQDGHANNQDDQPSIRFSEQQSTTAASYRMQNHLALHLQSIALISLPWQDDVEEDFSSDRPEIRRAEDSLIFSNSEVTPGDASAYIPSLDPDIPPTFEDKGAGPNDANTLDEWDFMSHASYEGHYLDPVLQAFVRRLNVDAMLAESKSTEPILPCHYLPSFPQNEDFFGRVSVLKTLKEAFCHSTDRADMSTSSASKLGTFILHGPGGVGKTQVAAEFIYRYREAFDAVFWIHADQRSKLVKDINRSVIKLGLVTETSADARDHMFTKELFMTWLANPVRSSQSDSTKASWLLVFDHVVDPDILNEFWPVECTAGSILITSRTPMPWGSSAYPTAELGPFTPEESAQFLHNLTGRGSSVAEQQCASILGQRLGGMPMTLTQLAGIIVQEDWTFTEFTHAHDERESKRAIMKLRLDAVPELAGSEHFSSEWAMESLEQSRALLDVLSMLDADDIPERILAADPKNVTVDGYPSSFSAYEAARSELLEYSLISRVGASNKILVHRIVQDAARRNMSPAYFRSVLNTCVMLISEAWPFLPLDWRHSVARWPICEELFPHIIRLREFKKYIPVSVEDIKGAYAFARLATNAGW